MARATIVRNSFNAGELSPLMAARVDQARYPNGCASLCNMLLHPHGGAWRRPGLRFMGWPQTRQARCASSPSCSARRRRMSLNSGRVRYAYSTVVDLCWVAMANRSGLRPHGRANS